MTPGHCIRTQRCNVGLHAICSSCSCWCHNPFDSVWQHLKLGGLFGRTRYELRRYRALKKTGKLRRRVEFRGWYWRFIKRYECEICQDCGCGLALRYGPSWWGADDELWLEVMGTDAGVLCVRCFSIRCDDMGIAIKWQPVVQHRRNASAALPGGTDG